MNKTTYQHWWPLHLRVLRGQSLNVEEQRLYEAGLKELDEGEKLAIPEALVEARARRAVLEAERAGLLAARANLEAEIAKLEGALGVPPKELLKAKD